MSSRRRDYRVGRVLVDATDACPSSKADLGIPTHAPRSAPGVSHEPVVAAGAIADNVNGVVDERATSSACDSATSVGGEHRVVGFNGDGQNLLGSSSLHGGS